ncbi:DUF924 family protein [Xanthomonas sp. AmX2]|uniref:DUF924 family protein n=1 Tax=Xanthomonas sp. TaxID=29446 RepID=UPI00197D9CE4|nr:DUF924 family protein [Xanthomonas sp.]MBN6151680.1 DUF924 family protein [Xanthomonas sp.]
MKTALHQELLTFWQAAGAERWFAANESFDANVRQHFLEVHHAAARGEHADWMDRADSALALVLLLDQVPRNAFRGSAHAYATDGLAVHRATQALDAGYDRQVDPALRMFFYLPFEHAEDAALQRRSVELFGALGDAESLRWALLHEDLIRRFGRFPHRNAVLGRPTTAEERRYLDEGGFAG